MNAIKRFENKSTKSLSSDNEDKIPATFKIREI